MATLISEQLREQYDDLGELYADAKMNEHASLMEKLIKAMAGLAKQIKEQEIYEKESLKRGELKRIANILGAQVGASIKKFFPDDDRAALIIDHIFQGIVDITEDKEL